MASDTANVERNVTQNTTLSFSHVQVGLGTRLSLRVSSEEPVTSKCPSQVSSGLVYAEVGPHVPHAAVTPPASDNRVQYTAVVHDQNIAKDSDGMRVYPTL